MVEDKIYKIWLLPVKATRKAQTNIEGGWYGPVPGVSMNYAIYYRVQDEDKAFKFTKREALAALRTLGDWPAKCVPPITVTY